MALYRFVGGALCNIGDLEFTSIGQQAEFPDEAFYHDVVAGGGPFVTEEIFEDAQISQDELVQLAEPGFTPAAPLAAKIEKLRGRFFECYALVRAGKLA